MRGRTTIKCSVPAGNGVRRRDRVRSTSADAEVALRSPARAR